MRNKNLIDSTTHNDHVRKNGLDGQMFGWMTGWMESFISSQRPLLYVIICWNLPRKVCGFQLPLSFHVTSGQLLRPVLPTVNYVTKITCDKNMGQQLEAEPRGPYFRSTLIRVFDGLKDGGSIFTFSFPVI
jgi:hypothetical protein